MDNEDLRDIAEKAEELSDDVNLWGLKMSQAVLKYGLIIMGVILTCLGLAFCLPSCVKTDPFVVMYGAELSKCVQDAAGLDGGAAKWASFRSCEQSVNEKYGVNDGGADAD